MSLIFFAKIALAVSSSASRNPRSARTLSVLRSFLLPAMRSLPSIGAMALQNRLQPPLDHIDIRFGRHGLADGGIPPSCTTNKATPMSFCTAVDHPIGIADEQAAQRYPVSASERVRSAKKSRSAYDAVFGNTMTPNRPCGRGDELIGCRSCGMI